MNLRDIKVGMRVYVCFDQEQRNTANWRDGWEEATVHAVNTDVYVRKTNPERIVLTPIRDIEPMDDIDNVLSALVGI